MALAVLKKPAAPAHRHGHVTNAQRQAAALRAAALRATAASQGKALRKAVLDPNATPDYFGTVPNFANSPLPRGPIGSIIVMNHGSGYAGPVTVKITDISWSGGNSRGAAA